MTDNKKHKIKTENINLATIEQELKALRELLLSLAKVILVFAEEHIERQKRLEELLKKWKIKERK